MFTLWIDELHRQVQAETAEKFATIKALVKELGYNFYCLKFSETENIYNIYGIKENQNARYLFKFDYMTGEKVQPS